MPQLVKKRRSGWAVLAAGALVASILAVGASPAAAAEQNADAQATWTACLGPAKAGGDFTDVAMDSVHYDAINCLAYYGVTTGKTADTYDPDSSVTRSQMALFLTRMAAVAGVDLGEAGDQGFGDLGSTGDDRVAAINVLAAAGIMEGRTSMSFEPEGTVTRADMAQHLFAFIDLALDSVHIDNLPVTVDGDGTGIELNVVDGDGQPVDDWFGDARRSTPAHVDEIIGAVYELGITTGTNNMVGEAGTFEPTAAVTRAQMASFIMRTLGHTNLRPAGVTAQQTRTSTQVSVRDADFAPIAGASVELFTTNYADDVFDDRGRVHRPLRVELGLRLRDGLGGLPDRSGRAGDRGQRQPRVQRDRLRRQAHDDLRLHADGERARRPRRQVRHMGVDRRVRRLRRA